MAQKWSAELSGGSLAELRQSGARGVRLRAVEVIGVLLGTWIVAGCTSSDPTPAAKSSDFQKNQVKWEPIAADALDASGQAQRDHGLASRDALAAALLDKLTRVIMSSGPETAIAVCRDEAPKLAEKIGQERQVHIGRTSFRLRNPKNSPPSWAVEWIESRAEEPRFAKSDQGDLAILAPIRLKRECLMCHGAADQLAPAVVERLASLYPQDQATGFAEGDLRGWFWIEVPRELPPSLAP